MLKCVRRFAQILNKNLAFSCFLLTFYKEIDPNFSVPQLIEILLKCSWKCRTRSRLLENPVPAFQIVICVGSDSNIRIHFFHHFFIYLTVLCLKCCSFFLCSSLQQITNSFFPKLIHGKFFLIYKVKMKIIIFAIFASRITIIFDKYFPKEFKSHSPFWNFIRFLQNRGTKTWKSPSIILNLCKNY